MSIIIEKVEIKPNGVFFEPVEGKSKEFPTKEEAWEYLKIYCDAFASPEDSIEQFKERTFAIKTWGLFRARVVGSNVGYRWLVRE